jgi:hypothetical protein
LVRGMIGYLPTSRYLLAGFNPEALKASSMIKSLSRWILIRRR